MRILSVAHIGIALAGVGLSACSRTLTSGTAPSEQTYLGLVRVMIPKIKGDLVASRVQVLGARVGEGTAIGWESREEIVTAPDKCHLVIIVNSDVSAANAREIVSKLEGRDPCIADFSRN